PRRSASPEHHPGAAGPCGRTGRHGRFRDRVPGARELTGPARPSHPEAMVFASRYTSRPIPDVSLVQYFRDAGAARAGQIAVIDGPTGRSYTFGQLLDLSASIAHGLIARGVTPGDRVAFICPNLPEVALAYHGAVAAGAVAMMVNPLSTGDELAK